MNKIILLLFFFLTASFLGYSQTNSISGQAVGSGSPLIGATVTLLRAQDSTLVNGVGTDVDGRFSFANIRSGPYLVKISYIGFNDLFRRVEVAGTPVSLGTLTLNPTTTTLKEVEVVGKAATMVQKADTSELNAAAFKVTKDANAENLIQKMPGITIVNGQVQAQGERVQRVLVDGKEFFGEDPNAVLRNLPAEVISKIQVFDRQSDQAQFTGFNDGNEQRTINIVTKPGMRNGQFGRFSAGVGTDSRYRVTGSLNKFEGDRRISILAQSNNVNEQNFSSEDLAGVASGNNRRGGGGGGGGPRGGGGGGNWGGGNNANDFLVNANNGISKTHAAGINYSDMWLKKIDVQGSYFFNQTENTARTLVIQNFVIPENQFASENNVGVSTNINHRANMRITYRIDSANSIILRPRITLQQNDGISTLNSLTRIGQSPINRLESVFNSELNNISIANNLLYRHSFAKRGRTFTLDVNTDYNQNEGESDLTSGEFKIDNNREMFISRDQISMLNGTGYTLGANATVTEPLTEKTQLQMNYGASMSQNEADTYTFQKGERSQNYDSLLTIQSSVSENRTISQNVGAGWRYNTREVQVMLNARYQWLNFRNEQELPTRFTTSPTYHNILPSAMVRYNLSQDKNIRLFYFSRTQIPSVRQLQEAIDISNPRALYRGNPALDQSVIHSTSLRYSAANPGKSSNFFILGSASINQNYIGSNTFVVQGRDSVITFRDEEVILGRGGLITLQENMGNQVNFRSFMTYGIPLSVIKSNLNFNASWNYGRTPGRLNGLINNTNNTNYGAGLVISSNISENLDFIVSSTANLGIVTYTLNTQQNNRFYNQTSQARLNWIAWKGLTITSDLTHQYNGGLAAELDPHFVLWNAGLGYKFMKDRQAEIRLTGFDLLEQNTSVQRNTTAAYVEDVQTNVLQRYFMVSFIYNLRQFGGGAGAAPRGGASGDRGNN